MDVCFLLVLEGGAWRRMPRFYEAYGLASGCSTARDVRSLSYRCPAQPWQQYGIAPPARTLSRWRVAGQGVRAQLIALRSPPTPNSAVRRANLSNARPCVFRTTFPHFAPHRNPARDARTLTDQLYGVHLHNADPGEAVHLVHFQLQPQVGPKSVPPLWCPAVIHGVCSSGVFVLLFCRASNIAKQCVGLSCTCFRQALSGRVCCDGNMPVVEQFYFKFVLTAWPGACLQLGRARSPQVQRPSGAHLNVLA